MRTWSVSASSPGPYREAIPNPGHPRPLAATDVKIHADDPTPKAGDVRIHA